MPMALDEEKELRGLSAPLSCQIIADIVGSETGALSGEHHWLSNGSAKRDKNIGQRVITGYRCSNGRRPPAAAPIISALIAFASLALMLSAISLALTCVALTTSPWQRRLTTADGQAIYKEQTNSESETGQNAAAVVQRSTHRVQQTLTKTTPTSVHQRLSSSTASSRRPSDSTGRASVNQPAPCECATIGHVDLGPPVAAHSVLNVSGVETEAGVTSNLARWQIKDNVSEQIVCRRGRLVALEDGLYAVYSQLYILVYPPEGEEEWEAGRVGRLWHGVFRRHHPADEPLGVKGEKEEELMRRYWTPTWRGVVGEASSHLAGVFNLNSNDELTVRWSKPVHHDKKMTYFGMFKIR